MITHLLGSRSLFVLQWRDFLHIAFNSPCLSHKSRNDHEPKKTPLWREIFPQDRDFHNRKILREYVYNLRTRQSWKVMKTSVCRRKPLRICKSTENYMHTFDVTKPFNFHSHRLVQNDTSNANQWESTFSRTVRILSRLKILSSVTDAISLTAADLKLT